MKKGLLFIIFLIIASLMLSYSALAVLQVPQYIDKYVNDFAGIFSAEEISDLRSLLIKLESDTTAEIVVVSADSCEGVPSQYAQEIFDSWKIGKKDKDNGLLVLYCKQENKIWVQTGYGLEGILPDSKIGRMLDDYYVPYKDGNITEGIIYFTSRISDVVNENREEVIEGKTGLTKKNNYSWILVFLIPFVIIAIVWLMEKSHKTSKTFKSRESKHTYYGTEKRYHGIKSNYLFNLFDYMISIAVLLIFAFFVNAILGIIAFFILHLFLSSWRGVRCARDGLKMKQIGKEGRYIKYKCPNGHIGKILIAAGAGYFIGRGVAGGFGGSGFSGGGFGGGFGGGASGGGGAGR